MVGSETLAIACGLGSALTWGAADFSGGMASRKNPVLTVLFWSQVFGLGLLVGCVLFFKEPYPGSGPLIWGGLAGLGGAFGIAALYRGLASGPIRLVAPLSAVVAAVIPMGVAMTTQGLPQRIQLAGFALALAGVWMISASGPGRRIGPGDLKLPVLAGVGFGLFFVFMDAASESAILWPLVAARCASVSAMSPVVFRRNLMRPAAVNHLPFIVLAGVLDTAGNAFFALAAQIGRLDIAAVLASLCPGATVVLAGLILKERIGKRQAWGVVLALAALVLMGA